MIYNLTCVVDDVSLSGSDLRAEHGLAFWIETDAGPVLLDTGQTGAVLSHNLATLNFNPQTLKAVVISHAHYDHTGGLRTLATQIAPDMPLYANADLFRPRFSQRAGKRHSIGLPVDKAWLHAHFALHLDDAPQQVLPGVWTTGAITTRSHPYGGSRHLLVQDSASYIPDDYLDDLSLVIDMGGSLLLLCGCCHAGLLNTLAHVQRTFGKPIVAIVGGTHLGSADEAMLNSLAQTIVGWGTIRRIYLNHCSGKTASKLLAHRLGADVVRPCPAGTVIDMEGGL